VSVEFLEHSPGQHDVIVRGRKVPMLSAYLGVGGVITVVFDGRLGLVLSAENYERVVSFLADVMENVMHPECGRTFNMMHEITEVAPDAS
jgi:hypothetical protein